MNNALLVEKKLGIELRRNTIKYTNGNPQKGADFIDIKTGKTYDDFGTGPSNKFDEQFEEGSWQVKLIDHFSKADITLLDLSKISNESKMKVLDYLKALPTEYSSKLIIL